MDKDHRVRGGFPFFGHVHEAFQFLFLFFLSLDYTTCGRNEQTSGRAEQAGRQAWATGFSLRLILTSLDTFESICFNGDNFR